MLAPPRVKIAPMEQMFGPIAKKFVNRPNKSSSLPSVNLVRCVGESRSMIFTVGVYTNSTHCIYHNLQGTWGFPKMGLPLVIIHFERWDFPQQKPSSYVGTTSLGHLQIMTICDVFRNMTHVDQSCALVMHMIRQKQIGRL